MSLHCVVLVYYSKQTIGIGLIKKIKDGGFMDLIQKVFLNYVQGWCAGDIKSGETNIIPGAKKRSISSSSPMGKITITDIHVRGENSVFYGWIIATMNNTAVWKMDYHGSYPKKVGPFLRDCIKDGLSTGEFLGGRGPHVVRMDVYTYHNSCKLNGFNDFCGREEIIFTPSTKKFGERIGWMEYTGHSI